MAITQIIQFKAEPSQVEDAISKATKALADVKTQTRYTLGPNVQEPGSIQLTAEWSNSQDRSAFTNALQPSLGSPESTYHATLKQPAFGPAASKIVEHVQIWFPTSKADVAFKSQIENDCARFDELFGVHPGQGDVAYGWIEEEQTHEEVEGGKARCFLLMRGWESMGDFQASVETEAFKKASPIVMGWGAPFKMWFVERKGGSV